MSRPLTESRRPLLILGALLLLLIAGVLWLTRAGPMSFFGSHPAAAPGLLASSAVWMGSEGGEVGVVRLRGDWQAATAVQARYTLHFAGISFYHWATAGGSATSFAVEHATLLVLLLLLTAGVAYAAWRRRRPPPAQPGFPVQQ